MDADRVIKCKYTHQMPGVGVDMYPPNCRNVQ